MEEFGKIQIQIELRKIVEAERLRLIESFDDAVERIKTEGPLLEGEQKQKMDAILRKLEEGRENAEVRIEKMLNFIDRD